MGTVFSATLIYLTLSASSALALDCSDLKPRGGENISAEAKGEIDGKLSGLLSKLGGAEADVTGAYKSAKTDTVKEYSQDSQLYIWERLIYLKCQLLSDSTSLTDQQKSDQVDKLLDGMLFGPPTASLTPSSAEVVYFRKSADGDQVEIALTSIGVTVEFRNGANSIPTNIVTCSTGASFDLARKIALQLFDSGIPIYNLTRRDPELYGKVTVESVNVARYRPLSRQEIAAVDDCSQRLFRKKTFPIYVVNNCVDTVRAFVRYRYSDGSLSRIVDAGYIKPGGLQFIAISPSEQFYLYAYTLDKKSYWCGCDDRQKATFYVSAIDERVVFQDRYLTGALDCKNRLG